MAKKTQYFSTGNKGGLNLPTTDKKNSSLTHHPPMVSYGTNEIKLLSYLNLLSNDMLPSQRTISLNLNINRSSVRYALQNLIKKQAIYINDRIYFKVSQFGQNAIKNKKITSSWGVANCPPKKLTHHLELRTFISYGNISRQKLKLLNPIDIQKGGLNNFRSYFLYFEDVTLYFTPRSIIYKIKPIIGENDFIFYQTLTKVREYIDLIQSKTDLIINNKIEFLQEPHFERTKNALSHILEKIKHNYYIDFGDGRKFWVDHSSDKQSFETNDPIVSEKIDNLIKDVSNADKRFKDICQELNEYKTVFNDLDKLKKIVSDLALITYLDKKQTKEYTPPIRIISQTDYIM